MCCKERHGHGHHHGCQCENECHCGCGCGGESCCGGAGGFQRRYRTKAEQTAELEKYLADLKAEVQAVEEQLASLRQ
jgi:hypothetical protein